MQTFEINNFCPKSPPGGWCVPEEGVESGSCGVLLDSIWGDVTAEQVVGS